MRTVISTVGTSILSNARRKNRTPEEWLVEASSEDLSAESNALRHLNIHPDRDRLIFLCSATEDGQKAGKLLRELYISQYVDPELKTIAGLHLNTGQFGEQGLTNLVRELCRLVRMHGPDVIINATGGFKAEVAYSTLVGTLFRVPVAYIYEQFKRIVVLPAMPVNFDIALYRDHEDEINAILNTPDSRTASLLFKKLPDSIRVLLEKAEASSVECSRPYTLSPVGEALREYAMVEEIDQVQQIPVRIKTGKRGSHTVLFGDGIADLTDLPHEIRSLLNDIVCTFSPEWVQLTRFSMRHHSDEIKLRRPESHGEGIQFRLICSRGSQMIILPCPIEERDQYAALLWQWWCEKEGFEQA